MQVLVMLYPIRSDSLLCAGRVVRDGYKVTLSFSLWGMIFTYI